MSRSSTRTPSRTTTLPATGGSRLSFLDHPMADYTLLLSATLVLLCLGLVMVLSASSVESFAAGGSSFDRNAAPCRPSCWSWTVTRASRK